MVDLWENAMKVFIWFLMGCFVWYFIGCVVLAAIDDEQERLFNWANSCPIPIIGFPIVVTAWPVLCFMRFKEIAESKIDE